MSTGCKTYAAFALISPLLYFKRSLNTIFIRYSRGLIFDIVSCFFGIWLFLDSCTFKRSDTAFHIFLSCTARFLISYTFLVNGAIPCFLYVSH
jgi:hypothetical protein